MEGMIGFLKKRINQDNKYQENLLNQALLLEQMNIMDILYPAPNVIHGNAGSRYRRFSPAHSRNSVYSPRWASIPLTKLAKLQGTEYSIEWMHELALIQVHCFARRKNLEGLDLEKVVAKWEHWGRCALANGDIIRSRKLEVMEIRCTESMQGIDDKGDIFYGKTVVYIRVPESFFDPETDPATDKLFVLTQLFTKCQNLFRSEILCQWSNEFRLVPLNQMKRLIRIFQAEDGEGRTFIWILHRHHSDALICPVPEPEADKALIEEDADQSDEMYLPDPVY
ncbi:hypothetical protein BT69DRAFT_1327807 [Atractiella rhizophila]|nr:hypothetical protein BT69DRAFT_1327807 [Atractiella rhizophila]